MKFNKDDVSINILVDNRFVLESSSTICISKGSFIIQIVDDIHIEVELLESKALPGLIFKWDEETESEDIDLSLKIYNPYLLDPEINKAFATPKKKLLDYTDDKDKVKELYIEFIVHPVLGDIISKKDEKTALITINIYSAETNE